MTAPNRRPNPAAISGAPGGVCHGCCGPATGADVGTSGAGSADVASAGLNPLAGGNTGGGVAGSCCSHQDCSGAATGSAGAVLSAVGGAPGSVAGTAAPHVPQKRPRPDQGVAQAAQEINPSPLGSSGATGVRRECSDNRRQGADSVHLVRQWSPGDYRCWEVRTRRRTGGFSDHVGDSQGSRRTPSTARNASGEVGTLVRWSRSPAENARCARSMITNPPDWVTVRCDCAAE